MGWASRPGVAMANSGRRMQRNLRRAAAIACVAVAVLFGLRQGLAATPAMIVAGAALPALVLSGAVLLLHPAARRWWPALLAALLWGASAGALGALAANDLALRALPAGVVSGLVAPIVEEAAKASALLVILLLWRGAVGGVADAVLFAALAGVGFATTENLGYYTLAAVQGGTSGFVRSLYLRGFLQGLNHAVFGAVTGAGVGWSLRAEATTAVRAAAVLLAFVAAVAVHATWNAVASPAINRILCDAPASGAACAAAPSPTDLLLTVPAIEIAFLGPVVAALVVLVRRRQV